MTCPVRLILNAVAQGHSAMLVHGRSLHDLVLDGEGRIRPLIEVLRGRLRQEVGAHLVTYSLADGVDVDTARCEHPEDRATIEQWLGAHGLAASVHDTPDVVRVVRAISRLVRESDSRRRWSDGSPIRVAFLLEFAEHLTPAAGPAALTEPQLMTVELAYEMAQSLALRRSGNLVLFHGRHGLIDPLLSGGLHSVLLQQPTAEEKQPLIEAALALYPHAALADGLTPADAARVTACTPNRGVEHLIRASHRMKLPVTAATLTARKAEDVVALSEGTMGHLDPGRVAGVSLVGRNIVSPLLVLDCLAARLRQGDARMPSNVLLSGAPGTGKTDLAILAAQSAGVSAYALHNPKRGIVGETERLARLQQELLAQFAPAVAFVDEITESLPMQRSDYDGDSGASRAVMGAMLTALSDETRRGRSLLIATTNCPWRISAAMLSRFVVVPVLLPLREDLPLIIVEVARRIGVEDTFDATDPEIQRASDIFAGKGATARHIREALTHLLIVESSVTPEGIVRAAGHLQGMTDRLAAIYADLWAIKTCRSGALLPWSANPSSYSYPDYLRGVIDPQSGEVITQELDRRLEEMRPHVSV